MKNRYRKSSANRVRWLLFIVMVFAILMPSNYLGKSISLKNISTLTSLKPRAINKRIQDPIEEAKNKSNFQEPRALALACSAFTLITSSVLFLIILSYLKSRPLSKQSLLLYLYGDILVVLLSWIWVSSVLVMISSAHGGMPPQEYNTRALSYVTMSLHLGCTMMLNAASCLKLLIAKTQMIDPIFVDYGYDDDNVLQKLRCFILISVLSFTALIHMIEVSPPFFYILTEQEM